MQVIVTTADVSSQVLPGFAYLFNKYWSPLQVVDVVGFSPPPQLPSNFVFHSLGRFEDYPANKWSDAMLKTLGTIADDVFCLLLDDYWLVRHVDQHGMQIAYDYMGQFQNVLKFDICRERLWNDPGGYTHEANTYAHAGHLDLIKSRPDSGYHMSLWGGLWRKQIMQQAIIPGETAQQIELNGTHRLAKQGDKVLVLGSRQAPLLHGNIRMGRYDGQPKFADTGWAIAPGVLADMRKLGHLKDLE